MSNRFINQSRHAMLGICATLAISGFYACTDSYDLDDKGNIPTNLGKSIYEELENPSEASSLHGTFKTYLRLIDDLGYKEVMSKQVQRLCLQLTTLHSTSSSRTTNGTPSRMKT